MTKPCPPPPQPEAHETLFHRIRDWVKSLACGMSQARTLGLAAEMSFWLFLSLVPLAAVAGLIVAKIAYAQWDTAQSLLASVPPAVATLVAKEVGNVASWRGGAVAPMAIATFVWLASSGVHAIFDALEVQTGTSRPWWKKRLLAIATCIGLSVGLALVAVLMTGLSWLFGVTGTHLPALLRAIEWSKLSGTVRMLVGALIAFGLIVGIYRIGLPRSAKARMPVVPGALLALVLQLSLGLGYGAYIRVAGTGDAYSAGLAVVGLTLMTLYLLSLALLIGAQFNQLLSQRHLRHASASRASSRLATV